MHPCLVKLTFVSLRFKDINSLITQSSFCHLKYIFQVSILIERIMDKGSSFSCNAGVLRRSAIYKDCFCLPWAPVRDSTVRGSALLQASRCCKQTSGNPYFENSLSLKLSFWETTYHQPGFVLISFPVLFDSERRQWWMISQRLLFS